MYSMSWSKPSQVPWPPSSGRRPRRPARRKSGLHRCQGNFRSRLTRLTSAAQRAPPQAAASLEQLEQDAQAAHQKRERLSAQREQVAQSIRHIGQASHFVDLKRGVRRNGRLIAADIHGQIDTIRSVAQSAGLSQTCLERIDKAERVVPKMQATIEFVSSYVHKQVRQLDLSPPVSYVLHAHLIPSFYLDRVAQSRTVHAGEPLRELAQRLRTPLFEPGGVLAEWSEVQQNELKQQAKPKLFRLLARNDLSHKGIASILPSIRRHVRQI